MGINCVNNDASKGETYNISDLKTTIGNESENIKRQECLKAARSLRILWIARDEFDSIDWIAGVVSRLGHVTDAGLWRIRQVVGIRGSRIGRRRVDRLRIAHIVHSVFLVVVFSVWATEEAAEPVSPFLNAKEDDDTSTAHQNQHHDEHDGTHDGSKVSTVPFDIGIIGGRISILDPCILLLGWGNRILRLLP